MLACSAAKGFTSSLVGVKGSQRAGDQVPSVQADVFSSCLKNSAGHHQFTSSKTKKKWNIPFFKANMVSRDPLMPLLLEVADENLVAYFDD